MSERASDVALVASHASRDFQEPVDSFPLGAAEHVEVDRQIDHAAQSRAIRKLTPSFEQLAGFRNARKQNGVG